MRRRRLCIAANLVADVPSSGHSRHFQLGPELTLCPQSTKSLRDSEASGLSEIYTHVRQRFE